MRKKSTYRLFATGNSFGIPDAAYNSIRATVKRVESPGYPYRKRVRVYNQAGLVIGSTIERYFGNVISRIDYDRNKDREEIICNDEASRDALAATIINIIKDIPGSVPGVPETGGTPPTTSGNNPPPTSGNNPPPTGGDNPSPTSGGTDDPKSAAQSKTTTYLLIAGAMILAIVLVIKFVK